MLKEHLEFFGLDLTTAGRRLPVTRRLSSRKFWRISG